MITGDDHLAFLRARRSLRAFTPEPVPRETLVRLLEAAITAPSSTNRQPWRFAVVTAPGLRGRLVEAVRARTAALTALLQKSHHAEDFGTYGDFFFEPLQTAAAIVVPQYREHPDLIANLLASAGEDPSRFHTAASMQAELCSASAAVMALLLQAHAEGLGACWMAGPMVARDEIHALLGIAEPWRMVGAIALGHPAAPAEARPRKPLSRVVEWLEDDPAETEER
jgi:F420 biosynthesis protein FbiB-like protein